MKQTFLFFLFFVMINLITTNVSAQEISYTHLTGSRSGISINMNLKSFEITNLNHKGEEMQELVVSGIFIPNDEGMPNLPRISRFIAIPTGSEVKLSVKNIVTEKLENINIAPALKIQAIPEEPVTDYIKNDVVYSKDEFYPKTPYEVSEVTSLRGVDVVVLGITPVQYNPVTKELIVINNIEFDVEFVGGTKQFGNDKYRSPWFDPIIKNAILNYDDLPEIEYSGKSSKDGEGCEYLIVIPNNEAFRPYAEQIKEYRTKQGIYTKVMSLEEMGVTSTIQMKSYFHNAYNNWDIPPVAVLLMADHNTNMSIGIPAEVVSHPSNGTCISDNQYSDVNGDLLPDMVFGRMAAEDEAQLAVLVSKFIEYETQPCMEESYYNNPITALGWQTERWFQICSEVAGGYWRNQGKTPVRINDIYDGTPGSIWSTAQNTNTVVNYFGPNGRGYIPATPTELGGWSGGRPADVINAVNNGAFVLQHRDHGYEDGWGEPSFNSNHIKQLKNVGKMTYLFTINCLTGKFNHNEPCFGEVFHRYTYQGQNAGCVGFLAPTEVSYSFVNDVFVWGMYDLYDPEFLPNFGPYADNSGNWLPAFGNVAGKYFLHQSNWPYNTNNKAITYQMFTAHSDVFLRLYTEVPTEIEISYISSDVMTGFPFFITCEEGAIFALTIDDEIITVLEGTGTEQEIQLPIFEPGTEMSIVATKQNRLRYTDIITVIPATGSHIICSEWIIYDENENGKLDYAETSTLGLAVKNIGVETAFDVTATLSIEDEYVTIEKAVTHFDEVPANEIISIDDAFIIKIANDVPNNHIIDVKVFMECEEGSWIIKSKFTAFAPIIEFSTFDLDGEVMPGETVNIIPIFANEGGAAVHNPKVKISIDSEIATVNTISAIKYNDFGPGESASNYFSFTIKDNAQIGDIIAINITLEADHETNKTIDVELTIDVCNESLKEFPWIEDFENLNSNLNCWERSSEGLAESLTSNGGLAGKPSNAYSGKANLLLAGYDGGTACFISPSLKIPTYYIATLKFWHAQIARSGNQDVLKIYFKESIASDWIFLEEFTEEYTEWHEVTIELPNNAKNVMNRYIYILFEGEVNGGNGIVIDDVSIELEINPCMDVINLNAEYDNSTETVNLSWELPEESDDILGYDVYFNSTLLKRVTAKEYSHSKIPFQNKLDYSVEAIYDFCTANKSHLNFSTCVAPRNLTIEQDGDKLSLGWEGATDCKSYNIYKNNELIVSDYAETNYIDSEIEPGEYKYMITSVYDSCGESEAIEINFTAKGIDDISNSFKVYPNPVSDILYIEGQNISSIIIYNTVGQVVFNRSDISENYNINISGYETGIYLIKVNFNDNSFKNTKVIINKK